MNRGVKLLNDSLGWIDDRFPLSKLWNEHLAQYYAPKNFNFWYYFGSLALLMLVIQIASGIWLTMFYKPSAAEAVIKAMTINTGLKASTPITSPPANTASKLAAIATPKLWPMR